MFHSMKWLSSAWSFQIKSPTGQRRGGSSSGLKASRKLRASLEALEPRVNCSDIDLSGVWVGTLTHPQVPQSPLWQETVSLTGSGSSPSGYRYSQDADDPNSYVQWSVTTSLSGNQFQIFDQSIDPGNTSATPPGTGQYWLQITATLTVSGNSMSGSWTSTYDTTTYSGSIQLIRQNGPAELTSTVASGGTATTQVGQPLQGYVEIDATSPLLPLVPLQAQIDNGDGTTSVGTVVPQVPGQVWDVYDTHTYSNPGTYTIKDQVFDSEGDTTTFQGQVTITAPPPPTPTPTPSPTPIPPSTTPLPSGRLIANAQQLAGQVFNGYNGTPIQIAKVRNKPKTYLVMLSGTELLNFNQPTSIYEDALAAASKPDYYYLAIFKAIALTYRRVRT